MDFDGDFLEKRKSAHCAPLLTEWFLYLYKANFIQGLLKKKRKDANPLISRSGI
jgi:hypothetical protein